MPATCWTTPRCAPPTSANDAGPGSVPPLQAQAGAHLAHVAGAAADVVAVQAHRGRGAAGEVPAQSDPVGEPGVERCRAGEGRAAAGDRGAHPAVDADVMRNARLSDQADVQAGRAPE